MKLSIVLYSIDYGKLFNVFIVYDQFANLKKKKYDFFFFFDVIWYIAVRIVSEAPGFNG